MKQSHIIILGGGYAGIMTAIRLSRMTGARITLVNAAPDFVERIRLHQQAAGQSVPRRPIASLLRGTGATFIHDTVTEITSETVITAAGRRLQYDKLVYALGSYTDRDSVPGVREHAFTLMPDSVAALYGRLGQARHLAIVGGGATSIEAAAEFAESFPDLRVSLITRGRLGDSFSEKGAAHLYQTFARLGVDVREGVTVTALEADRAHTSDGAIPFDVSVWAGPFIAPSLARQSGLSSNARGQILVDSKLRAVSNPNIYAVGDAAYLPGIRMACATAMPMGAHAADNIGALLAGREQTPFRFGYILRCLSLGRRDGLVQIVRADDSPREKIFTGRAGAFIKEQICRMTISSLSLERHLPGRVYRWPQPEGMYDVI